MQKKTPDYDNMFKTMKSKHKRLTFTFPDGQAVNYESANVILEELFKGIYCRKEIISLHSVLYRAI